VADYKLIASMARNAALTAIHQGNPVRAREWIEAAAAADAAVRGELLVGQTGVEDPVDGSPSAETS
jgi:hypothetical protein